MDVNLNKGASYKTNSYKNTPAKNNASENAKNNAADNSAVKGQNTNTSYNPAATVDIGNNAPTKKAGVYGPFTGASRQRASASEFSFEFNYSESTSTTIEATVGRTTAETSGKEKMTAAKLSQKENMTIKKLQEDAEKRTEMLRKLVESLLSKQGSRVPGFETKPVIELTDDDMIAALKSGKLDIDPETAAKAAADISEDGYWGVKQTSERLVSFAMNLSGHNVKYADNMIEAIKKGYKDAESKWGGELPDLCKNTLEAAIKQLEDWRDNAGKNDAPAPDLKVNVSYSESSSVAFSSTTKIEA